MRLFMQAIVMCLCLNMAVWMVGYVNVPWIVGMNASTTPEDLIEQFNVNETKESWSGESSVTFYGYFYDGVQIIFRAVLSTIFAFPYMLGDLGAPYYVTYPLYAVYSFLSVIFFVEMITGRQILDI